MRIALCDDSKEMLLHMNSTLNDIFKKYSLYVPDYQIHNYTSGRLLIEDNRKERFDVVFLDIDMPNVTGFDVARDIRFESLKSYIIFITAYSELVYDCFDFQPFDFIRKNDSLSTEFDRVVHKLLLHTNQNKTIVLEDNFAREYVVPIRNIIYIESDKHYLNFYVNGKQEPFIKRATIKEFAQRFEKFDFVQIHKSYIVNLRFIDAIQKNDVNIFIKNTDKKLPVSRNLKKEVSDKYKLFLRNII